MRKRIFIAAAVMLVDFIISPIPIRSQALSTFTRTALSRMDVLSRAALFEKPIAEAAQKEGLDPLLLWTIAYKETRFRPWLTSPRHAQGLMQFLPATASRFGLGDPYEPDASINAAARYVKYLGGLFEWRVDSILAAYNSGEGAVMAYLHGNAIKSNGKLINSSRRRTIGGVPPYKETVNYVSQGLKIYRWLETQDRFRGGSKNALSYATNQLRSLKHDASEDNDSRDTAARKIVLYDPRTGRRFLIDSSAKGGMQPINQDGSVIISPGLRGLPSQKARTTFSGVSRP